jgi:hypothetical protein
MQWLSKTLLKCAAKASATSPGWLKTVSINLKLNGIFVLFAEKDTYFQKCTGSVLRL